MIQTKQNKRGRPTLDEQQKIDRETLKQLFLSHTPEALETIVSIMKHSMDSTSRLKASMFILNKIVPDGFILKDETNHNITAVSYTHLTPILSTAPAFEIHFPQPTFLRTTRFSNPEISPFTIV